MTADQGKSFAQQINGQQVSLKYVVVGKPDDPNYGGIDFLKVDATISANNLKYGLEIIDSERLSDKYTPELYKYVSDTEPLILFMGADTLDKTSNEDTYKQYINENKDTINELFNNGASYNEAVSYIYNNIVHNSIYTQGRLNKLTDKDLSNCATGTLVDVNNQPYATFDLVNCQIDQGAHTLTGTIQSVVK